MEQLINVRSETINLKIVPDACKDVATSSITPEFRLSAKDMEDKSIIQTFAHLRSNVHCDSITK